MDTQYKNINCGIKNIKCGGVIKCRAFVYIHSYQLSIDCYNYKIFHVSLMVTTRQNLEYRHKRLKKKESEHTATGNYQITKDVSKRGRKEQRNCKTSRKQ